MGKGCAQGEENPQIEAIAYPSAGLNHADETNTERRQTEKSLAIAYILALLFGVLGVHHFYLGRKRYGLVYLFTGGLLGIGYTADLFRVPCLVKEANRKLSELDTRDRKTVSDAYILWFPFGIFGFHHFYLRNYGYGLTYVLTLGVFGIGWLIDGIRIPFLVKRFNMRSGNDDPTFDAYIFLLPPFGLMGAHHYYLNRPVWGLLYVFTFGLLGFGWIFDFFRMPVLVRRAKENDNRSQTENQFLDPGDKKYLDDAYILLFPLGFTGLHHFYLGRYCWGFLYLCTLGIFGLGFLIDFCRLPRLIREYNRKRDENLSGVAGGYDGIYTITSTLAHGDISASVELPQPEVFRPEMLPRCHPLYEGARLSHAELENVSVQPPSYMEAVSVESENDTALSVSPPAYDSRDIRDPPRVTE